MCGIAGIIHQNIKKYESALDKMRSSLAHRGPDRSGVYFFDTCALAHTRLSVVDLNTGDQPMLSRDKKRGVVFNGEIYGYKDIKKKFKGYDFRTESDTEVLLALYERYGQDLLDHLPGMFSFAVWDSEKKELFCARDRFGEKPFYYAKGKDGEFIFSSEIKGIISSGLVDPVIDKSSIGHYLKRLYVHPYKTIYRNIFCLPPAHSLRYRDKEIKIKKYWVIPEETGSISMEEAVYKFKDLFGKAVKKCLTADVPVAVFLSGGLDSSSVVFEASQITGKISTISFGFRGSLNELDFARRVAEKFKTDHLELCEDDFNLGEIIFEMQKVYDEPFADSSNIPVFLISKLASRKFKVVLGGDGADELLAGYPYWYKDMLNLENKSREENVFDSIKKFFKINKANSVFKAHLSQNVYFRDKEIGSLLGEYGRKELFYDFQKNNTVNDALKTDVMDYLPGDILVKTDRAAMANGLELRAPFLDIELSSFCLSLPSAFKISDKEDKIILRRAYRNSLPESVLDRPKQGFGAPVHEWLQEKSVQQIKKEYLGDRRKKIFQILSFDYCQRYYHGDSYKTWILLILSLWMEENKYSI